MIGPSLRAIRSLLFASFLFTMACGGRVVVDISGGQGAGTGPGGCTDHSDCPSGLCLFTTGTCTTGCNSAKPCPDPGETCGPGTICDGCATSSCFGCNDCIAACVPAAGRCDADDPCPTGQTCIFESHTCAPLCDSDSDCGEFAGCNSCVSSCCGCDDCVSFCTVQE